jgi:hypothetical protein
LYHGFLPLSRILTRPSYLFTVCHQTLDFISEVLALENWAEHVPSLASAFPDNPEAMSGAWKEGNQFLRIDGSITGADRGDLIKEFNQDLSSNRLFLISSRAGGIGINLCSANRVVLFDSTFNPTIMTQAVSLVSVCNLQTSTTCTFPQQRLFFFVNVFQLYRCYRYGQQRSVFAYRFLTEGSMEERVYSRAVNKTGLALRVVDDKNIRKSFSKKEVEDLIRQCDWVQCNRCEKWRMFPPSADVDTEALPDRWFCEEMGQWDKKNSDCSAPERSQLYMEQHFARKEPNDGVVSPAKGLSSPAKGMASDSGGEISEEKTELLVARDAVLQGLLKVSAKEKKSSVISKYYFHDALLEEKDLEEKDCDSQKLKKDDNNDNEEKMASVAVLPQPSSSKATETKGITPTSLQAKLKSPKKRVNLIKVDPKDSHNETSAKANMKPNLDIGIAKRTPEAKVKMGGEGKSRQNSVPREEYDIAGDATPPPTTPASLSKQRKNLLESFMIEQQETHSKRKRGENMVNAVASQNKTASRATKEAEPDIEGKAVMSGKRPAVSNGTPEETHKAPKLEQSGSKRDTKEEVRRSPRKATPVTENKKDHCAEQSTDFLKRKKSTADDEGPAAPSHAKRRLCGPKRGKPTALKRPKTVDSQSKADSDDVVVDLT